MLVVRYLTETFIFRFLDTHGRTMVELRHISLSLFCFSLNTKITKQFFLVGFYTSYRFLEKKKCILLFTSANLL